MDNASTKLSTGRRYRILVVDDHPVVRMGVRSLLSESVDFEVCGEAEDANHTFALIEQVKPDAVIADITLGQSDGINMIRDLHRRYCSIPVLVMSMHDESLYGERVLRAGAKGYVQKSEVGISLLEALRSVVSGKTYVSKRLQELLLDRLMKRTGRRVNEDPMASLSDREFEIFRLIGKGLSTRLIAERLSLSIKTVETYRERIKNKFGFTNSAELVAQAIHRTSQ